MAKAPGATKAAAAAATAAEAAQGAAAQPGVILTQPENLETARRILEATEAPGVTLTKADGTAGPVEPQETDAQAGIRLVPGAAEELGLRSPHLTLKSSAASFRAYEVYTAKGKLADVAKAVDEGDAIAQVVKALSIQRTEKMQFYARVKSDKPASIPELASQTPK